MALLGMIGFTALMLEGLRRTSAADAGIITAMLPAVAARLGVAALRERLSLRQAGAVALALAGRLRGNGQRARHRPPARQPAGHGCGRVRGEFVILGKRLGAALSAIATGARRQCGWTGLRRSPGPARPAVRGGR